MRIADIAPWPILPARAGGPARVFNLMYRLAERHAVTGFSHARCGLFVRPRVVEERHGDSYADRQFSHAVGRIARKATEHGWVRAPVLTGAVLNVTRPRQLADLLSWADLVVVEFPWQFEHCRLRAGRRPVVYSSHNVEADKFVSYADAAGARVRWPWLQYIQRAEANACRRADLVLAVSPADRDRFAERYGVNRQKILVVPNGADTKKLRPVGALERARTKAALGLPERPMALFMGGGPVPPNLAGLDWVRRLAAEDDRFTYVVVGAVSTPRVERPNLIHLGIVPDSATYMRAADVSLVPIQHGGGTKIKLLESLAMGLPTIAFAEALHGTVLAERVHVLVADKDVRSIRAAMDELVDDPDLAAAIGTAGSQVIRQSYDWASIAGHLDNALIELVEGRGYPPTQRNTILT